MLNLRFVEINQGEIRQQEINKYPCIIGRNGTVKPLITNGALSLQHCTICYDFRNQTWTISDGVDGKKSSNGIFSYDRKTLEIDRVSDKISIINEGDRVYLLSKSDGPCAYVELHKNSLESPTQDFDPALVRLTVGLEEVAGRSIQNSEKIGEMEGVLKKVSNSIQLMQWVGQRPIQTLSGVIILLFAGFGIVSLSILNVKGADIIDYFLESRGYKIEQKK
jgi:hypothetical protein